MATITIGAFSNVQDGAVLHGDPGQPVWIGQEVTIGHRAVIHGATLEDGCLVGIGAIVLNGVTIGAGALVAAGMGLLLLHALQREFTTDLGRNPHHHRAWWDVFGHHRTRRHESTRSNGDAV